MSTEQTPLLGRRRTESLAIDKASLVKEASQMFPLAWPVSVGYLLQMSLNTAAVLALGRLGTNALASMALATLYANVTGYSLIVGMGAAIDTLCSQAFGEHLAGTGEKRELGRHLSRTIFIMYIMCIPISILWWFTEPLLLLANQDPQIAALSAKYTRLLIPSLFPFQCLIAGMLLAYARFVEGGDAFGGWEWKQVLNVRKLWNVTQLGVSGILMTCSEWWAWEIVALMAGILGPEYLAAQTIVLTSCQWAYTMPMGFSIACTTRIGNALGAGSPYQAKLSAFAGVYLGVALTVMNSSLFLLGRNGLGYLFSDDEKVIEIVKQMVPLVAAFQFADIQGCICAGILRGAGRQEIGAYLNIFGYYVFGIPIGTYVCFNLGGKLLGLWTSLTVILFIVCFVLIYMIWRMDWDKEADNATSDLDD
ncbi:MATE efflux family protein [Rhizoclosmatium globosum]|uniref:MATE efflux family protein n=1 Tax=Rhizoclosmatium globosum TaxID=329046 RepID=A0A1Y2BTU6_9FUNG|nr:MATE efflux family protein [Rhizoclosmatium globosum]|eukprot:ORY38169.1 MATE efflux family protein [Rhizoclosmatium globosum]